MAGKQASRAKSRVARHSIVKGRSAIKRPAQAAPRMRHRKKATDPAFDRTKRSPAGSLSVRPKKRARTAAEAEGQGEGAESPVEHDDSDFNSSDLDPVLWAVGGQELEESGKIAERIKLRRDNKKKRRKGERDGSVGQARQNCQATPEARALLSRGHAQFAAGDFADAIETMRSAIREQPGLADPYHVLHLIYSELGEEKKALDALLLSAYFTSPVSEARPVWRRVAELATRLGEPDQAGYAYKRCIGPQGSRTMDDLQSMWQLSQLHFKKDRVDKGIVILYDLYEETQEPQLAVEVAKKLVQRHRWKECLALLETCVDRGCKADPPRVDLNVLNILAEVLMELRDFEKCATLLKQLLHLAPKAGGPAGRCGTALAQIPATDKKALTKRLQNSPVDLVAKLAVALCQTPTAADGEDLCCQCAIEVVLSYPPDTHQDLYLVLVDAMLADAGTTADTVSQRWRQRAHVRPWMAGQASRILTMLEKCDEDLRERTAMCNWRMGKVEEAAQQLEELLEDPGDRTEIDLRNLRVRAAEAWIECGNSERADQVLSTMTYEDLQRSNVLPPPMSAAERRKLYTELNRKIEMTMEAAAAAAAAEAEDLKLSMSSLYRYLGDEKEVKSFISGFRHLVYDCELDYKRLSAHTSGLKDGSAQLSLEDAKEKTKAAGSDPPKSKDEGLALVVKPSKAEESLQAYEKEEKVSTSYRWKRKHLGLDSVEDMFGFEAYLTFVKMGVEIIRSYANSEKKSREGIIQAARAVELCEMIISNRRLVSMRNPVKRRMVRDLAMVSLLTGFEARLWKVVFKHMRMVCDRNNSDHLLALFTRILFTHADVDCLGASPAAKDRADVAPWAHEKTSFSASGHRNSYAAAFTDVRGWALRKLLKRPHDYGLTLLCAHFCTIASQYPFAVAEYSRAHRLAPFEPLPSLCTATAYISFSMSRAAVWRHDLVLKGLTFLQRYRRLRLRDAGVEEEDQDEDFASWGGLPAERQPWEEMTDQPDGLAVRAEVAYNYGRAFHQLSMFTLAQEAYEEALSCFDGLSPEESQRTDVLVLRRSAAWNLAYLYKAQGTLSLAADVLWRHVVW